MDEHEARAFRYRQRAEELRAILTDMKDEVSCETLVKIAADYDPLADIQDGLARELKDKQRLPN